MGSAGFMIGQLNFSLLSCGAETVQTASTWMCVCVCGVHLEDTGSTAYTHLHSEPISHWIKELCCSPTAIGRVQGHASLALFFYLSLSVLFIQVSYLYTQLYHVYNNPRIAFIVPEVSSHALPQWVVFIFIQKGNEKWFYCIHLMKTLSSVLSAAGWSNAWGSSSTTGLPWGWRATLINILYIAPKGIWPL